MTDEDNVMKHIWMLLALLPAVTNAQQQYDCSVATSYRLTVQDTGQASFSSLSTSTSCTPVSEATPPPDPDPNPDPNPNPTPVTGVAPPMSSAQTPRLDYMMQQFSWYKDTSYDDLNAWLYDRVQLLYELYIRTNDENVHAEALKSAQYYVQQYNDASQCKGGWGGAGIDPCNFKYTYASACWYVLKVDGQALCDEQRLSTLYEYYKKTGWNATGILDPGIANPETFNTTERNVGYALMGLQYVYRTAQDQGYVALASNVETTIHQTIQWLYEWQAKTAFGAWMHSYNGHEGSGTPGQNDWLMFSPWQSAILTGALWRTWSAGIHSDTCGTNNEPCIPEMLIKFAQAMESYGWVDNPKQYEPYAWSHDANTTGQIAWYIATPDDFAKQLQIQNADGYYSDEHNPENQCQMALGYYFSQDASQKSAFQARYRALDSFYVPAMANISDPPRIAAWQNSSNPSCEWLIEQ